MKNADVRRSLLEDFELMVKEHDLTYSYSDDGRVWRKGEAERSAIVEFSNLLPRDKVVEIWNKWVDRKIGEGYRDNFYWRNGA